MFKKILYHWQLGVALLMFTLFYSINIYFEWIYPVHTTALFGFVFFLWLGAQLHKKWYIIEKYILSASFAAFIVCYLLVFAFALAEARWLAAHNSTDPFNTLRISNICYSLVTFGLLVKIGNLNVLRYLKPRETTYGIYLVHYIIIYNVLEEIYIHFSLPAVVAMSAAQLLIYQYSRFLIVYLLTFAIVSLINKTRFKWIIGNNITVG